MTQLYGLILTICFYLLFWSFFKMQVKGTSTILLFIKDHQVHLKIIGAIVMVVLFVSLPILDRSFIGNAYGIAVMLYVVKLLSEIGFRTYQKRR